MVRGFNWQVQGGSTCECLGVLMTIRHAITSKDDSLGGGCFCPKTTKSHLPKESMMKVLGVIVGPNAFDSRLTISVRVLFLSLKGVQMEMVFVFLCA